MTDPSPLLHGSAPDDRPTADAVPRERVERVALDRRHALGFAVLAGASTAALAACGSGDDPADEPSPADQADDPTPSASEESSDPPAAAGGLVATADVPVGGGVVLKGRQIVVTQPADGEFKAFTAVCTHAGCTVNKVADNTIACPCHGSMFSAEDGSVQGGPATDPLEEIAVSVEGGQVVAS